MTVVTTVLIKYCRHTRSSNPVQRTVNSRSSRPGRAGWPVLLLRHDVERIAVRRGLVLRLRPLRRNDDQPPLLGRQRLHDPVRLQEGIPREVHLRDKRLVPVLVHLEVDVRGAYLRRVFCEVPVLALRARRVRARLDGLKHVPPVLVAAHAAKVFEIGVQRERVIVTGVVLLPTRARLPHLDLRARDRLSCVVRHPPPEVDHLAERAGGAPVCDGEVIVHVLVAHVEGVERAGGLYRREGGPAALAVDARRRGGVRLDGSCGVGSGRHKDTQSLVEDNLQSGLLCHQE